MKTVEEVNLKLRYCQIKLEQYEGHLSEDPDLNYIRGYKDALEWMQNDEEENSNDDANNESSEA